MSPQMQQAISLLQMPVAELSTAIESELSQNPVLEYMEEKEDESHLSQVKEETNEATSEKDLTPEEEFSVSDQDFEIMQKLDEEFRDHFAESGSFQKRTQEDEKKQAFLETSITEEASLFERLMDQAIESFDDPEERRCGEAVIGNLDERGFLTTPVEEIAILEGFEVELVEMVLSEVQTFEPFGVGAKDLQESLLIQLRCLKKRKSLAYSIIEQHYDDMLHNRIPAIQKSLNVSPQDISRAIEEEISKLDLKPGVTLSAQKVQYIQVDLTIRQEEEQLIVDLPEDNIPHLRLNSRYLRMLNDKELPEETKEYIKQRVLSGKWLMRNINQRNETIVRIAEYLIKAQRNFFLNPDGELAPLTMKTVAEELELHESTIARAVSNKYIDTPRGILPLRSFFTNSFTTDTGKNISSNTVRDQLLEIVKNEDKSSPLSDAAISQLLQDKGIPCARRTVAKYRRELNLGTASQRKSY